MIKNKDIEIEEHYTEGFEITIPSPMILKITEGKFVAGDVVYKYGEFELDIESDPDLTVIYDIYLLSQVNSQGLNVRLDRTEMGGDVLPYYDGATQLIHTLLSIQVPPDTTDLNNLEITVRNVLKVVPIEKDGGQDET